MVRMCTCLNICAHCSELLLLYQYFNSVYEFGILVKVLLVFTLGRPVISY